MKCGKRTCSNPATQAAIVPYDGDYIRCDEHIDEAVKVGGTFANRLTDGVRVVSYDKFIKIKAARRGQPSG